jgi:hypothetical protein
MNRPTRKRTHLLEKLTNKEARSASVGRKPGKKAKRWRTAAEAHKPVVAE